MLSDAVSRTLWKRRNYEDSEQSGLLEDKGKEAMNWGSPEDFPGRETTLCDIVMLLRKPIERRTHRVNPDL